MPPQKGPRPVDTAHLTLAQYGAYARLLDYYHSQDGAIVSDLSRLYIVAGALTPSEKRAVRTVVEQFFPLTPVIGRTHVPRGVQP